MEPVFYNSSTFTHLCAHSYIHDTQMKIWSELYTEVARLYLYLGYVDFESFLVF